MSSILGINQTIELLHRLKGTVREFTLRDDAIRQAWQAKRSALAKSFDASTQQRAAELQSEMEAEEGELKVAQQLAQGRFEQRQARILRAHKAALKRASDAIDQSEGRQKYHVQKRTLEAERQRESDLAASANRLAQFRSELAASEDGFASLESAAHRAFSGFPEFRRLLTEGEDGGVTEPSQDENQVLTELGQVYARAEEGLRRFRRNPVIGLFRMIPLWLVISFMLVVFAAGVVLLPRYGIQAISVKGAAAGLGGALALVFALYWIAKRMGRANAVAIVRDLSTGRQWQAAALRSAAQRQLREDDQIKTEFEKNSREFGEQWRQAVQQAEQERAIRPKRLDEKKSRAVARNSDRYQRALEDLHRRHMVAIARLRALADAESRESAAAQESALIRAEQDASAQSQKLEEEWRARIQPLGERIQSANEFAQRLAPGWSAPSWRTWTPPETFAHAAPFGSLEVDLEQFAEVNFRGRRLTFPGPNQFSLPLLLKFPEQGSLLFETGETGSEEAITAINAILFRLLSLAPSGKLGLTIFDPIGLGQNFAGLMHLADYEDSQVNSRIWTQTGQIEERLGELNEHMEKVIQMYLRNEYATIAEYNEHAGAIAEKYHLLVIAGFPVNFSETAGRRLLNIAASGARCGVYTLIQWDSRHELPHDFIADELRKHSVRISATEQGLALAGQMSPGLRLRLDPPPPPQFTTDFLRKVGQGARDSNRVELPFAQVAPEPGRRWTEDATSELRIPIGRSGAAKLQYLALGKGTRQHALIAGKTGSGKSTLFHVIITNMALWCSPEEVEFYLVDFKKGVEFKCYANQKLPHARVVAIESDREFGLSVLQRVDDELRRRGDLFRKAGAQDLAAYRKTAPGTPLPRLLLMIDEFQEFFTEEDRLSQSASVLLDRVVRQGRAFGIHVLLGSQTLGGAYTLARATMGQMVIRIALQCNEADAYLIMDESNAAPRLLSRPGEGIYNDMAGALEGNSPFQVAWLSDEQRDAALVEVRAKADATAAPPPGPLVFEGNAPASVRDNQPLADALLHRATTAPRTPRVWLGSPNSIKGPSEVVFHRQSGSHLLIVGQRAEAALAMASISLISLASQYPRNAVRLILLESTAPGSPEREFLDRLVDAIPHPVLRPKRPELGDVLNRCADEVLQRADEELPDGAPTTFLLILGLQDFKPLRAEDDFSFPGSDESGVRSPAAALSRLISEGPSRGFHVITTVDSYNNVARFLGRKGLSEFETRVLFQMSASDSASLMDNPDASRLGLHRALLYNEREGYLEKFRPYALPDVDWIKEAARALS